MKKPIASVSRTREILEKNQLMAKKGYGQNFLIDVSIAKRIAATIPSDGVVLEIGPGIGSLTEQLAIQAKKVIAYEVDERLPAILEEELSDYENVEIRLKDFLTCDLENELGEYKDSLYVAANLPYYITSPVLFQLFEATISFPIITVMIQKEVADRFIAKPNTKEYGSLSVEAQYLYDIKRVCNAPKTAFMPSPNVDSTVISFIKKEQEETVDNLQDFFTFVKACFKQRRKTIYNNLKEYLGDVACVEHILKAMDLEPSIRAQALTVLQFVKLYHIMKEQVSKGRIK